MRDPGRDALLFWAIALVLVANLLATTGVGWFELVDPTPVALAIAGVVLVSGVFRFGLLDLVPVARTTLVQTMPDPVLVVDAHRRVVDHNLAAERVFVTSAAAGARWAQRTGVSTSVLHAPSPPIVPDGAPVRSDAITAVHLGPDTSGARLLELAAALRLAGPAVSVHLCGGIADPLARDELCLLAARLRPGCLTMDAHRLDAAALADEIARARAIATRCFIPPDN